jgi:hypothetical protein
MIIALLIAAGVIVVVLIAAFFLSEDFSPVDVAYARALMWIAVVCIIAAVVLTLAQTLAPVFR